MIISPFQTVLERATLLYLKNLSPAFGRISCELTEWPVDLTQRPAAGEHHREAGELQEVECTPVTPEITSGPISPVSHHRLIKTARFHGDFKSQHVLGLKKFHGPKGSTV